MLAARLPQPHHSQVRTRGRKHQLVRDPMKHPEYFGRRNRMRTALHPGRSSRLAYLLVGFCGELVHGTMRSSSGCRFVLISALLGPFPLHFPSRVSFGVYLCVSPLCQPFAFPLCSRFMSTSAPHCLHVRMLQPTFPEVLRCLVAMATPSPSRFGTSLNWPFHSAVWENSLYIE